MASLVNDFGLSGKFGNVIIYRRGNKSYVRRVLQVRNPNTEKQQMVRARFLVAIKFYQKLKETSLKRILTVSAQGNSANGYTFYLEKNVKAFCADGHVGDFSQLQFSAGKRQRVFHLSGTIDLEGRVLLEWKKEGGLGFTEDDDRLVVVVLNEGRIFCPKVLEDTGAVRKDGVAGFTIDGWEGESLHLYCFFVSPDEKQLSESQYVCLQGRI